MHGAGASALALVIGLFSLLGTSSAPRPAGPLRVCFETLASQHIVVAVKINGQGPFRLIFDTGAPVTLLNNRAARAGKVFPPNYRRPLFALFGAAGDFQVKRLEVGQVQAADVPVVVMDHPLLEYMSKLAGPLEGILGCSFWGRYQLSIDYQARELTFVPVSYRPPDMSRQMEQMLQALAAGRSKSRQVVLAPAGQWGFRVCKEKEDTAPGVTIAEVFAGSAAAEAGLRAGDRLLTVASYWTDSVADCYAAAARIPPGTAVRLTVRRGQQELTLTLRVRTGL